MESLSVVCILEWCPCHAIYGRVCVICVHLGVDCPSWPSVGASWSSSFWSVVQANTFKAVGEES